MIKEGHKERWVTGKRSPVNGGSQGKVSSLVKGALLGKKGLPRNRGSPGNGGSPERLPKRWLVNFMSNAGYPS